MKLEQGAQAMMTGNTIVVTNMTFEPIRGVPRIIHRSVDSTDVNNADLPKLKSYIEVDSNGEIKSSTQNGLASSFRASVDPTLSYREALIKSINRGNSQPQYQSLHARVQHASGSIEMIDGVVKMKSNIKQGLSFGTYRNSYYNDKTRIQQLYTNQDRIA